MMKIFYFYFFTVKEFDGRIFIQVHIKSLQSTVKKHSECCSYVFFFFFTKVPQIISKLSWRRSFAQLLFVVFLYSIVVCMFAYDSAKINLNFDWKRPIFYCM